MKKVIGAITTYHGDEHAYLRDLKVRIVAILKKRVDPGADVDHEDAYITDEEHLARAGGVTADDRIEVQPFIEPEGHFSFVTSDPRHRPRPLQALR